MAFTSIKTSQRDFLVGYLRGTGRELSANQAQSLFGIQNLRARMTELRQEGYRVRTRVNTLGRTAYAVSRRMQGQN
jgi:hypothetical protein